MHLSWPFLELSAATSCLRDILALGTWKYYFFDTIKWIIFLLDTVVEEKWYSETLNANVARPRDLKLVDKQNRGYNDLEIRIKIADLEIKHHDPHDSSSCVFGHRHLELDENLQNKPLTQAATEIRTKRRKMRIEGSSRVFPRRKARLKITGR